jgi:hypothetical protein
MRMLSAVADIDCMDEKADDLGLLVQTLPQGRKLSLGALHALGEFSQPVQNG